LPKKIKMLCLIIFKFTIPVGNFIFRRCQNGNFSVQYSFIGLPPKKFKIISIKNYPPLVMRGLLHIKVPVIYLKITGFMVAEAGLEPATSGL
jgi:hypothetical protein